MKPERLTRHLEPPKTMAEAKPASSARVEDLIDDIDFGVEDEIAADTKMEDTERGKPEGVPVHEYEQGPAHDADEHVDVAWERLDQQHEEMLSPHAKIDLLKNVADGIKPRNLLVQRNLASADKSRELAPPKSEVREKVKPISIEPPARALHAGVGVRGNMEDGYEITVYGGGIKTNELTASLKPSIIEDLERDEHIEHVRHLIHAINQSEEAANSNKSVKGSGRKRSKRHVA